VSDEDKSTFDKAAAEKLWNTQEVMGDTAGSQRKQAYICHRTCLMLS